MSDAKRPDTLLVMPVKGKYCELMYDNRIIKIWKVHPNTPDSYGTPIPYDVGVHYLGKTPSVIALVPRVENKKFVSDLLPEDKEAIDNALKRGFTGSFKNYNKSASLAGVTDPAGSNEALTKTLEVLDAQIKKNAALEESLLEITNRLALLEAGKETVVTVTGDGTIPPAGVTPPAA